MESDCLLSAIAFCGGMFHVDVMLNTTFFFFFLAFEFFLWVILLFALLRWYFVGRFVSFVFALIMTQQLPPFNLSPKKK